MTRAINGLIAIAIAIAAGSGPARADVVDDEGQALATAPSYKRRLAAALTLSKLHDGRAVRAEAFAEGDAEALGRQVAGELLAGGAGELLAEA